MNILKTLAITATLIVSCNHLSAQQKEDTAGTVKKWYIKDACQVSETQSLAIYEHTYSNNGIVLLNNVGAIQWEQPFDGCVMAIGKYKDHVLVFYAQKGYWDKTPGSTTKIKQINAATIDIKSQKIIDDKVIYTGSKPVIPDFQNDAAGNFSQLLLRQTKLSMPRIKDTKGYTLITLNADGSAATKEISSLAIGGKFIGSSAGKDGSFFISSIQNWSSIVVEKFSHEGAFLSKLESPLTLRDDPYYYSVMRTDPYTNNAVALTLRAVNPDKDDAYSHMGFNFDNNQVAAVNEAPLTKKLTHFQFNNYSDLKPVDILFTNDKVAVVREVSYRESRQSGTGSNIRTTIVNYSKSAVVSVFDKQMKPQREIVVSKNTTSYSSIDIGLSCRINKDKLFILSSENASSIRFDNFCYKVNLNDGSFERKKIGVTKPSITTSICTLSTVWFPNEFIMTLLHIKPIGVGPARYSTVLERVGFDTL